MGFSIGIKAMKFFNHYNLFELPANNTPIKNAMLCNHFLHLQTLLFPRLHLSFQQHYL